MAKAKKDETASFEAQLADLEAVVGKLESGDQPLEESLKSYEQGVVLVRALNEKLTVMEKRIEILSRNDRGDLATSEIGEDDL